MIKLNLNQPIEIEPTSVVLFTTVFYIIIVIPITFMIVQSLPPHNRQLSTINGIMFFMTITYIACVCIIYVLIITMQ